MQDRYEATTIELIHQVCDFAEESQLEGALFRHARVAGLQGVHPIAELLFTDGVPGVEEVFHYPRATLGRCTMRLGEARAALLEWAQTGMFAGVDLGKPPERTTLSREARRSLQPDWPAWTVYTSSQTGNGISDLHQALVARGLPAWRSLDEALRMWFAPLGPPRGYNAFPMVGSFMVRAEDRRARIAHLEWEPSWQPDRIRVSCEGRPGLDQAQLQIRIVDAHDRGETYHHPAHALVEQALPEGTRGVSLYLLLPDGTLADELTPQRLGSDLAEGGTPSLEAQIADDLHLGEGEEVEFKPFIAPKDTKEAELAETVVAFANSKGGRLYVGVDDSGTLLGHTKFREFCPNNNDRTLENLEAWFKQLIRDRVKPSPALSVDVLEYQGAPLLVARVEAGSQKPYSTRENDIRIRSGASNRRPDPQTELLALMSQARAGFANAVSVRI